MKIKSLVKDKPSRKMLFFAGTAIVAILGYTVFFSGGTEEAENSRLRQAPQANDTEVPDDLSPAYREAMLEADRQRIEEARDQGDSATPSLIGSSSDQRLQLFDEEEEEEEVEPTLPTVEVTPIPVPREDPPPPPPPPEPEPEPAPEPPTPEPTPPPPPAPSATPVVAPSVDPEHKSRVMSALGALTGDNRRSYGAASTDYFYSPDTEGESNSQSTGVQGEGDLSVRDGAVSADQSNDVASGAENLLPLPGNVLYAEMISRANSDAPGPVLARVLEGPLSGATVIGQFSVAQDALVIQFSSMTIETTRDGHVIDQNIPINTVAVDAEHIGTAMATDVDNHLFERVALSFATSFIEGISGALVNSGSTTVNRSDGSSVTENEKLNTREQVMAGAGNAASEVGDILDEYYGSRAPTIIVESGTPIGLLFL